MADMFVKPLSPHTVRRHAANGQDEEARKPAGTLFQPQPAILAALA